MNEKEFPLLFQEDTYVSFLPHHFVEVCKDKIFGVLFLLFERNK